MDFVECACTGKSLTRLLRPAILAILKEYPTHGYVIAQRLEQLSMFREQPADVSGIYRVLKTMETENLVRSKWEVEGEGMAKRSFEITDTGIDCLRHWISTLEKYQSSVLEILDVVKQSVSNPGV